MKEPDIERAVRRLEAVLRKERREALVYTLLTVLSTPVFVALASLVIAGIVLLVMYQSDYQIDSAEVIYMGMVIFLASAIGLATANLSRSSTEFAFDRTWLAGVVVFVVLLVVTYATPLSETSPALFGIFFTVLSFLTLGLVGQAHLNHPPDNPLGHPATFVTFALAISGFVVSAYGELLSASWLWFPPPPEEIRIAARVLCRLDANPHDPPGRDIVGDRVVRLLSRLKLIEISEQQQLHLTPKGLDFLRTTEKE